MCLRVKSKTTAKAKEDIVSYKFFVKGKDAYISPYYACEYKMGVVKTIRERVKFTEVVFDGYCLGKGMLYSYADLKDAINRLNFYKKVFSKEGEYCICECVIPKGTTYYEGKEEGWKSFDKMTNGYASKKLMVVKEVHLDCNLFQVFSYNRV